MIYASDYGFASQPQAWSESLSQYDKPIAKDNNWLYVPYVEWTISRYNQNHIKQAFCISETGYLSVCQIFDLFDTRPVFYLESSVNLNGGNGTAVNPYRIF